MRLLPDSFERSIAFRCLWVGLCAPKAAGRSRMRRLLIQSEPCLLRCHP